MEKMRSGLGLKMMSVSSGSQKVLHNSNSGPLPVSCSKQSMSLVTRKTWADCSQRIKP